MAVRHLNAGQRELAPIEWPPHLQQDKQFFAFSDIIPKYEDRMRAMTKCARDNFTQLRELDSQPDNSVK